MINNSNVIKFTLIQQIKLSLMLIQQSTDADPVSILLILFRLCKYISKLQIGYNFVTKGSQPNQQMSLYTSPIHSRPHDLISVKDYHEFEQYSNQTQKRNCTDILCIIIGALFALVMIVASLAVYNRQHFFQANFPTDSDGRLCGIDHIGYPYVYFTTQTEIGERVCVAQCPSETDQKLNCKATRTRGCNFNSIKGYEVEKYETIVWEDRNGHFCLPQDQSAREIIFSLSKLKSRNIFFNSIDIYIICSVISTVVALVFFLTVQFFPKVVNKYILYVGSVALFILIICVFTYPTEHVKSKVIVGLILVFFLIVVGLTLWLYKEAVLANGVFLSQATKLIKEFPLMLVNIPLFLLALGVFQYIMILQLNAIWTHSDLWFEKDSSLYWQYTEGQGGFLKLLWFIQALWGLHFIKQSFNFIISTYSILQYNHHLLSNNPSLTEQLTKLIFPYRLYFTKHIGSVIACSFMSAFFSVFDTIFDLARGGKINRGNTICDNLDCFFDLVRSEAMPYIAITGNSYCNAARYCQYLGELSPVLENSQSASRAYRIAAYSTLSCIVAILGLYINGRISIYGIGIVIAISYFIVNFFVQVHADSADGILIAYLQSQEMTCRSMLEKNNKKIRADFGRETIREVRHDKTREIVKQLEEDHLYQDQKANRARNY